MSEVEWWRELQDGAIEFTVRRLGRTEWWQPKTATGNRSGPAVEVRETRSGSFFGVRRGNAGLSRSSREVTIVAGDTEKEAWQIASRHDAFGRDWRDPHFAACDSLETPVFSAM